MKNKWEQQKTVKKLGFVSVLDLHASPWDASGVHLKDYGLTKFSQITLAGFHQRWLAELIGWATSRLSGDSLRVAKMFRFEAF